MVRVTGGWVSWVPFAERGCPDALGAPLRRLLRSLAAWTKARLLLGLLLLPAEARSRLGPFLLQASAQAGPAWGVGQVVAAAEVVACGPP